jgi:hypothetical protein
LKHLKKTSNFLVLLCLSLLVGCGTKKNLPEGAPKTMRLNALLAANQKALPAFTKLRLSGKGSFTSQEGRSQSFKFDLRLQQDSLLWLSLKDPLLGLSIAKGQLTAQKASYYNSLERHYFEGPPQALEKRFAFNFNFLWLTHLLSAQLVEPQQNWSLNYQPGFYQLQDFDPSGQRPPNPRQEVFTEVLLNPETFTPHRQTLSQPVSGRIYKISYSNYQAGPQAFPQRIVMEYLHNGTTRIELTISSVDRDGGFGFPFKIPSTYAPLP